MCVKWAEIGKGYSAPSRIIRPVLYQVTVTIMTPGRRRCRD